MEKPIKVKCKLCKHKFEIMKEQAINLMKKNNGYIPCEQCDSHATLWRTPNEEITHV